MFVKVVLVLSQIIMLVVFLEDVETWTYVYMLKSNSHILLYSYVVYKLDL